MDKKPLIVVSLFTVVILVLASLGSVVGYQTVQSLNKSTISKRVNQRDLLFQMIVDIANNKEIQRIILKSQMSRGIHPISEIPIVTKQQLRRMYFIGLILSKFISKTRIQSMAHTNQLITPEIQQEINEIIENYPHLREEITQLVNSECYCEKSEWGFPILCAILQCIGTVGFLMTIFGPFPTLGMYMVGTCLVLGTILNCYWLDESQYKIVG